MFTFISLKSSGIATSKFLIRFDNHDVNYLSEIHGILQLCAFLYVGDINAERPSCITGPYTNKLDFLSNLFDFTIAPYFISFEFSKPIFTDSIIPIKEIVRPAKT